MRCTKGKNIDNEKFEIFWTTSIDKKLVLLEGSCGKEEASDNKGCQWSSLINMAKLLYMPPTHISSARTWKTPNKRDGKSFIQGEGLAKENTRYPVPKAMTLNKRFCQSVSPPSQAVFLASQCDSVWEVLKAGRLGGRYNSEIDEAFGRKGLAVSRRSSYVRFHCIGSRRDLVNICPEQTLFLDKA